MKKSIIIISILALVVCALVLTGCGSKESNQNEVSSIIGKWKNDDYVPGYEFIYTFNEDGTGNYDAAGTDMPFRYVITGDSISIFYDGDDVPFETKFEINGDVLNVKDSSGNDTLYQKVDSNEASIPNTSEDTKLTNEDMYGELINNYKKAVEEYDLENIDIDDIIKEKYGINDTTLLMHIARYSNDGVELTYKFYDIDKNGVDELLIGASDAIGAIYSFDKVTNKPVDIFFQDTLERGDLSIYDNGIIFSEGSGGAALHYFEFGKIADDGISYELLESIEEEYFEDNETPKYTNTETGEELKYTSLDEITNKYILNANQI